MSRFGRGRSVGWCVAVLLLLVIPSLAGSLTITKTSRGLVAPSSPRAGIVAPGSFGTPSALASPVTSAPRSEISAAAAATLAGESTLALFNDSLLTGNVATVPGSQPTYDVFDPQTNEIFITDFYANIIDVVSTVTNQVVGTVPAPIYPNSIAYDPVNGNVYVGLQTFDSVEIIDGATLQVVANDSVGLEPFYLAADPVSGNVFVVGQNHSFQCNVTVLSGTSGAVVASFSLGAGRFPMTPTYDPRTGDFYVPTILAGLPQGTRGNLTVVNASHEEMVGNISLTFNPAGALYVPSIDSFYVANSSGNNLTVLNGSSDLVTGQINGPNTPGIMAYAANGNVYVGTFENNITVIDSSTGAVIATFSDDRGPDGFAYDPLDQELYATDYVWNNVTAYSTQTNALVATVLLGVQPTSLTYDTRNHDLYVYDRLSNGLVVINGSTDRVVGTLPNGSGAIDVVYDPVTNDLYETNYYGENLSILNATTGAILGWLGTGTYPWDVACDPTTGDLYVTNAISDNVTVIDAVTRTTLTSLPVGDEPLGIAFDPAEGTIDVADYVGSNVTVIDAASNHDVTNVSIGPYDSVGPITLVADDPDGDIFVQNGGTDNVTVIGGTNLTAFGNLSIGQVGSPLSAAYDPLDGAVYFANQESENVSVVNDTTFSLEETLAVGKMPTAVAFDPADGAIAVTNYDWGSLSLAPMSFPVQFTESGLPPGTNWSVNVSGVLWTTNTSALTLYLPNGTVAAYSVVPSSGYLSVPPSGTVTVNGAAVSVALAFSAAYSVTFAEFGLPALDVWSVTFAGNGTSSNSSTIQFLALDGTDYAFTVGSIAGYLAFPPSGFVTVSGGNVTVTIDFEVTYPVTFIEQGIESPISWAVDFNGTANGSTTSSIGFAFANESGDTYSIVPVPGYTAHPSRGTVGISGHAQIVPIVFIPVYRVTFTETGLPSGTVWGTTFNNTLNSSTAGSIVYLVPNGTGYTYHVTSANPNYEATPASGSLVVDGEPQLVPISWALRPVGIYQIQFIESGLPRGTPWEATLLLSQPDVQSGTGSTLRFNETNGTYAFSITPVAGYNTTPEIGSVIVSGANVTRTVNFTVPTYTTPTPGSSGTSTSDAELYIIVGAVIFIAVVVGLAVYWTQKEARKPPSRPAPSDRDDNPP
jgi:YVTN family beta-propeller protein